MAFENLNTQFSAPGAELAKAPSDYVSLLTKMMENRRAEEKQPYELEHLKSQTQEQNALANWYKNRLLTGMGGGVDLKNVMALGQQIMRENPGMSWEQANTIAGAHLNGDETLPDGSPVPALSGVGNQMLRNVQNRNAPVALKNMAAQYDVMVNDLDDFDIDALKAFAGPQGKARLAGAKLKMATNPDDPTIDPMARRALSALSQSILNMDQMRKAFGTSVVPEYVYNTIGRLANPADSIWNDPTQVEKTFKDVVKRLRKNRNLIYEKVKHGVTAGLKNENESGNGSKKIPVYNPKTGDFE